MMFTENRKTRTKTIARRIMLTEFNASSTALTRMLMTVLLMLVILTTAALPLSHLVISISNSTKSHKTQTIMTPSDD